MKICKIEYVDLQSTNVSSEAVSKITGETARKYSVFPFDIHNSVLYMAMLNPEDIFLIDEIKIFAKMEIRPFRAEGKLIGKAIEVYYQEDAQSQLAACKEEIDDFGSREDIRHAARATEAVKPNISSADKLIQEILQTAVRQEASDVHIDSFERQTRVRYRIDGRITDSIFTNVNTGAVVFKIKKMSNMLAENVKTQQKGKMEYKINENEVIGIEALTLPTVSGEKLLLKVGQKNKAISIEEIGLSPYERDLVWRMISGRSGMLVVTGPGGSGRTTTCYAVLKEIAKRDSSIITIEKKVIEKLDGVSQLQLSQDGKKITSQQIKNIIEHDPDVVFIDEDVDRKSIKTLMSMAVSGKFVIVTMPYTSVFECIRDFFDMGIEPQLFSRAVNGIIAQNTVRKLCSACHNMTEKVTEGNIINIWTAKKNNMCTKCNGVGYKGKAAVFEVLSMDRHLRSLISGKAGMNIIEARLENSFSTLKKNCIRLVNEEVTSIEEIAGLNAGKDAFEGGNTL